MGESIDEYPCLDCGVVLRATGAGRAPARCVQCRRVWTSKQARKRHRRAGGQWANRLWWKYGITVAEYEQLLAGQKRRCAICGAQTPGGTQPKDRVAWPVDHDHSTGQVRGLLCTRCNAGIGFFRDDPAICRRAAKYLSMRSASEVSVSWLAPEGRRSRSRSSGEPGTPESDLYLF